MYGYNGIISAKKLTDILCEKGMTVEELQQKISANEELIRSRSAKGVVNHADAMRLYMVAVALGVSFEELV